MDEAKLIHCPALVAIRAISGKWKTRVLWLLRERPYYFGELRDLLPGVSPKVLTEQLRQLAGDGIILARPEQRQGVTHVGYDYTDYGRSLMPVLDALGAWGQGHEAMKAAGRARPGL